MQAIYTSIFKFFCLPVFILMIIGKPRFLINLVHKFIEFKDPIFKLKIFRFIFFLCCLTVGWSFYRKRALESIVDQLVNEQATRGAPSNVHFIDEKLREAHLHERNCYMFLTFIVLMAVVEKFCHIYFKLWSVQDAVANKQNGKKDVGTENKEEIQETKTPSSKKTD